MNDFAIHLLFLDSNDRQVESRPTQSWSETRQFTRPSLIICLLTQENILYYWWWLWVHKLTNKENYRNPWSWYIQAILVSTNSKGLFFFLYWFKGSSLLCKLLLLIHCINHNGDTVTPMLCNDSAQFKEQAEANTQNELQAMTREISLPNALLASGTLTLLFC